LFLTWSVLHSSWYARPTDDLAKHPPCRGYLSMHLRAVLIDVMPSINGRQRLPGQIRWIVIRRSSSKLATALAVDTSDNSYCLWSLRADPPGPYTNLWQSWSWFALYQRSCAVTISYIRPAPQNEALQLTRIRVWRIISPNGQSRRSCYSSKGGWVLEFGSPRKALDWWNWLGRGIVIWGDSWSVIWEANE
jgi:hypothetical protein